MAWKTVNAAQSTDARSQNAFRRFSNILMSHRNANGNIQYNPQDKSYRLVNDNGIFYSNGRFFSKSGIKGNYNVETGSILNKRGTRPSTPSKQQPSTKPKNAVPWKTAPVYSGVDIMTTEDTDYTPSTRQTTFYPTSWKDNEKDFTRVDQQTQGNSAYILRPNSQTLWKPEGGSNQKESSKSNVTKPQVTKNSKAPTTSTSKPRTNTSSTTSRPRTALAPKAPASNSWINKGRGIWNYNGVSQADVANAYKTGDFSKVGSYLSQHKDLASYLNNVYSKRGGNQFNQSAQTPAVNTMTLQTLNNVVPKSPVKEITPTVELPTAPTPTYNRSQTRDYMRSIGMNPYDYSGGERKALRTYLNNPGSMDSKYQPFINQVQNQRTQKMVNSIGTNQLLKPETDTNKLNNQLVNLKFEKGGQMYKYAAGAQMVQPQQTNSQDPIDQIAQIAAESLQGDENSKQQLIQVLSNKEIAPKLLQIVDAGVKNQDKRAVIIAQAIKALQQGSTRKARLGAKLDYIKQSIGECPEGQEVVYFKKGGEICKICAGKKMQDGGKSDPIKNFKKKKDVAKQTYQRNPYTRGKSAKEIAEMQRRNRQEAGAGKGENDANVAPWNYKKEKDEIKY